MADDTTMAVCPICGFPGEAGAFCINGCGVRLTQSETPRPETATAVPGDAGAAQPAAPAASIPDGGDAAPRAGAPLPEQALAKLLAAMQKVAPAQPVARSTAPAQSAPQPVTVTNIAPVPLPVRPRRPESARWTSGELPPALRRPAPEPVPTEAPVPESAGIQIRLTGRFPSEFVEGLVSPLPFTLQTTGPNCDYHLIQLSICRDGKSLLSSPPLMNVGFDGTCVSLNHIPRLTGRMNIRVRLACRRAPSGDEEVYESDDIDIYVWPKESDGTAALTVNYAPTISGVTADRAGDVKLDGLGLDLKGVLPGSGETLEQRMRRLAATAVEKTLPLHIVSLPRRLTLWDEETGKFVHVLTGDKLRFGRHKANDVVLRVFDEDRSLKREDSLAISKIHFTVENDQDVCRVSDGGLVGDGELKDVPGGTRIHATFGTAVSGKKLSRGGRVMLAHDSTVDMALAPDVGKHVLGLSAHVKKCSSCSRCTAMCPSYAVSSLLLTRSDDLEVYLAVWKCADLGDVLPELKGYFVEWDRNRFVLRCPAGGRDTLWPGMKVGDKVWVRPFKQSLL